MFDDQNLSTGGQARGAVPNNLPMGEPEDMFSGAATTPAPVEPPAAEPTAVDEIPPPQSVPSAVSAGVLRPKLQAVEPSLNPTPSLRPAAPSTGNNPLPQSPSLQDNDAALPPVYGARPTDNVMSEPMGGRKVLYTLIIIVSLGILGGGGTWIYFSFINPGPSTTVPLIDKEVTKIPLSPNDNPEIPAPTQPTVVAPPTNSTTSDDRILFGEPILDTDDDSLDDSMEKKLGTDMLKWDTDADGLSDGDEVLTWKTDPLKADTDGDTYSDSAEIKNGYNPKGPGKLFPVTPTSTTGDTTTNVNPNGTTTTPTP